VNARTMDAINVKDEKQSKSVITFSSSYLLLLFSAKNDETSEKSGLLRYLTLFTELHPCFAIDGNYIFDDSEYGWVCDVLC